MSGTENWAFPESHQPSSEEADFELPVAFDAMFRIRAEIPENAFTAGSLGTERTGNGVLIRSDGVILTIGYLITEAESIWLTANDGSVVAGYPLAYDQVTGFGLVRALGPVRGEPVRIGSSSACPTDSRVYVIGHGGREHSLRAKLVDKREFAGYWEYLLDEALFTSPAHPEWGGSALLDERGELIGIGSLLVQEAIDGKSIQGNMFVPIDLLAPILDDMLSTGQADRTARPWLGLFAQEHEGQLVVAGVADGGPALAAGLEPGDAITRVGEQRVSTLADFLRAVWACGAAGARVPLSVSRGGDVLRVEVVSVDRNSLLRRPPLH